MPASVIVCLKKWYLTEMGLLRSTGASLLMTELRNMHIFSYMII